LADSGKDSLIVSLYFGLGIFIWLLLGAIISFVLSRIVPWSLNQISKLLAQLPLNMDALNTGLSQINHFLSNPFSYVVMITGVVLIVGAIARLFNLNKNQVFPPNLRKP
jgi:ammonia channel protein AmtB